MSTDERCASSLHRDGPSNARGFPNLHREGPAIVVTVGEKIGKAHLTYGMGAAAELIAASTILLAQFKGMPVSTTHILSSGVAGTMVADGAGLQRSTIRNIALAWIMTLPAAMVLSAGLYALLLTLVRLMGLT